MMYFVAAFDLFTFCLDLKSKLLLAIAMKEKAVIFIWLGMAKYVLIQEIKYKKYLRTN